MPLSESGPRLRLERSTALNQDRTPAFRPPCTSRDGISRDFHVFTLRVYFRNKEIIGIELGSGCFKAVAVGTGGRDSTPYVRDFTIVDRNDEEPLEKSLASILRKLHTRCRDCAIATYPGEARMKFFDYPRAADPAEVRASIRKKPSGVFMERLDDYAIDSDALDRPVGRTKTRSYVACGLPHSTITAIESALRNLRYHLKLVQVTPIATFNAFAASQPEIADKQTYILADFGYRQTTLLAGIDGVLTMTRTVGFGWENARAVLSEGERPAHGSPSSANEESGHDDLPITAEAVNAFTPLLFELQRSLEYLRQRSESKVSHLYVSGGLSTHRGVMRMLGTELSISVEQWNPFRKAVAKRKTLVNFELLSDLSRLPAAAGVALQYLS